MPQQVHDLRPCAREDNTTNPMRSAPAFPYGGNRKNQAGRPPLPRQKESGKKKGILMSKPVGGLYNLDEFLAMESPRPEPDEQTLALMREVELGQTKRQ